MVITMACWIVRSSNVGIPQHSCPAVRFGNVHPFDGRRYIGTVSQVSALIFPRDSPEIAVSPQSDAVYAGRTFISYHLLGRFLEN